MTLAMYARYCSYLARHKWFVFVEACRLGIPVRGLVHDLSKLRPSEWFPYMESFYGPERTPEVREAFDTAWLHHQNRNDHHWQYWCLLWDDGITTVLPMPDAVRREMLADWMGAGKAQGLVPPAATREWYLKHRSAIRLHRTTRAWVEQQIGITPGDHPK